MTPLDHPEALTAAVRKVLEQSPLADPAALLAGQTLATADGDRYAVHAAAWVEGRLVLRVVPLRPATLTITVTHAATSAEVADVRPAAPTPADVASRLHPAPTARWEWPARPGLRAAVSAIRRGDGLWQAACDEHGDLDRHTTREGARHLALRHAWVQHGCSVDTAAGDGR